MTLENPRRHRADRWWLLLIPLGTILVLGGYGYTWRETTTLREGLIARLNRIEEQIVRVLCKLDPDGCLRGGPR